MIVNCWIVIISITKLFTSYNHIAQIGSHLPRSDLPSSRAISTTMIDTLPKPSSPHTSLLMTLGQFIAHDTDHVPIHQSQDSETGIDCCDEETSGNEKEKALFCFPIEIPSNDEVFQNQKTCLNFVRSICSPSFDCKEGEPIQQVWLRVIISIYII